MKKVLFTLLALGAASGGALAQSSVTIYGVADAGLVLEVGVVANNLRRDSTGISRVRALDDELLASYGERYLRATQHAGSDPSMQARRDQLRWRWRLLRNKVPRGRD